MKLNTSSAALFTLSSLFFLGSSLPFSPRRAVADVPLVRRATYSIVPVDGGASGAAAMAAGGSSDGDSPTIETITQITPPTTMTVVESATLPATTDYIISTKSIEGSKTTQTVLVTVTPSPSPTTVAATGYSVVDVDPVTVYIPEPVTTVSSSSSKSLSTSSSSVYMSSITSTTVIIPPTSSSSSLSTSSYPSASAFPATSSASISSLSQTSTSPTTALSTVSTAATSTPSSSLSTSSSSLATGTYTSTIPSTTSTSTYDNGQWHTTYPVWANSTATRTAYAKAVQTTSSTKSLPTLPATTIVAVPSDSVPLNNAADIAKGAPGEEALSVAKRRITREVKQRRSWMKLSKE